MKKKKTNNNNNNNNNKNKIRSNNNDKKRTFGKLRAGGIDDADLRWRVQKRVQKSTTRRIPRWSPSQVLTPPDRT